MPWSYEISQEEIIKKKQIHVGEALCKKQPKLTKAAEYIESLSYHNIPDYEKLFSLIEECNPSDLKENEPYDWQYRLLNPVTTPNETPGGTKENATPAAFVE